MSQFVHAKSLEVRLPAGTYASAELRDGKPGLPTVLLIHGFMQTREFPTISRLADGLASAGYSVLSPTLSLGISRRSRNLPCEAVHRHTLEQDVAEIAFWVEWLAQRKPGPVVIVGHSYGSLQSLIYAAHKPAPSLHQVIALSLVDAERQSDTHTVAATLSDARKRMARGETELVNYLLAVC